MASFRIVSIPKGPAPEEARKKWIGLVLPLKGSFNPGEGAYESDFSLKRQQARSIVTVPVRTALDELAKKSPEAAQWFYDNLPKAWLQFNRDISFGIDEVEILDPV